MSTVSETLTALEAALSQASSEELPDVIGGLAKLQAQALAKLTCRTEAASPHQAPTEPLLTLPQVAERLNIPASKAYELARQGRLPTVRVGKYVRVRPSELDTWLARQRVA